MPDPNGFLRYGRQLPARRPVPVRIRDYREVYPEASDQLVQEQATRCMDCGIPFCHEGCPLGNRIPDWNDLVRTGGWARAIESLHATNNFPEFTGRLCPAPCEGACVLGIGDDPVAIKQVEVEIINRAFANGYVTPQPPVTKSGKRVAVVGSGPAGLAAAQQLARAGHDVVVLERDDRIGGLMRYGIPDFKLEKEHIDRRMAQMEAEGVVFRTGVNVGVSVNADQIKADYDAVVLAAGALAGRDTPETPGRTLKGVHLAMDHLVPANRVVAGLQDTTPIDAAGKSVVIIGGGDTAADCLGVAHRQGATEVFQLDIYPEPPSARVGDRDPWPTWPYVIRNYPAHEEGGVREFAVAVQEFVDNGEGQVSGVRIAEVEVSKIDGRRVLTVKPGSERVLPADLVLLAIGFEGTEEQPLLEQFGIARNPRGAIDADDTWQTAAEGVFVAGDMHRGASLIVWAIAEGRAAAAAVHHYLGAAGQLPAPVGAAAHSLSI
ncbi:glutamate synthase subunit beta [Catenuloplanes japonicus]|uniref:glutamate synthase subunit beta n=1 Tax=Catenuloplanes japonicus TaxID=33876 RepID=UPI0005253506|nr:glutamate synthase subunit beta [Catenuloplanes japonicus]